MLTVYIYVYYTNIAGAKTLAAASLRKMSNGIHALLDGKCKHLVV